MISEERQAYFADIKARDADFWYLWNEGREQVIPVSECEPGYLYWGGGRTLGELAICRAPSDEGVYGDVMRFEGLSNASGIDILDTEIHYDESSFGTWSPNLKVEKVPDIESETELMSWLLDQTIVLKELRIHWLKSMPYRLRQAPSYEAMLDDQQEYLEKLMNTKKNGFSKTPTPTIRQILESKRRSHVQ